MVNTSLSINLNANPSQNADETSDDLLIKELNRMSIENKKLTEMLIVLCENYNVLQTKLTDLMQRNSGNEITKSKKRKAEDEIYDKVVKSTDAVTEGGCSDGVSCKRPKEIKENVSVLYSRTDSSDMSLVVKDGYQWRKYGQKVTRDNPSPRAYYKCSFAPSCSVKKKVQRNVGDSSFLVARYEGKHNHPLPFPAELSPVLLNQLLSPGSTPGLSSISTGPLAALDLQKEEPLVYGVNGKKPTKEVEAVLQQFLVENMASSLLENSSFTAALAMAISRRIVGCDHGEK